MDLFSAAGQIHPASPFDFEQSLGFIQHFPPMMGEQTLAPRKLTKTISIQAQPIVFELTSTGTVDAPQMQYRLTSNRPIAPEMQRMIEDRIRFFLSLDDPLANFYALAQGDPPFWAAVQRVYGLHQVKFLTPFEIAAWAVLTQRMPIALARNLKRALKEAYGCSLELDGARYTAFPEPSQLVTASTGELNNIIKNERKVEYLQAVTRAFDQVDEQFLRSGPYSEVEAWLLGIKGIGDWSAHFILIRGLGRVEKLSLAPGSVHEKELVAAVSRVYAPGRNVDGDEILRLAERYGDWQGYWAYYLRALGVHASVV
jgi:DNA-3-methyladenine glycosylase II